MSDVLAFRAGKVVYLKGKARWLRAPSPPPLEDGDVGLSMLGCDRWWFRNPGRAQIAADVSPDDTRRSGGYL